MNLGQAEKQQEEGFSDKGASENKGINVNRKGSKSTPGKAPSFAPWEGSKRESWMCKDYSCLGVGVVNYK